MRTTRCCWDAATAMCIDSVLLPEPPFDEKNAIDRMMM